MSEAYETQFPEGLRVIAIDDNVVCLKVLVTTLEQYQYKVTTTTKARRSLNLSINYVNFVVRFWHRLRLNMDLGYKLCSYTKLI